MMMMHPSPCSHDYLHYTLSMNEKMRVLLIEETIHPVAGNF